MRRSSASSSRTRRRRGLRRRDAAPPRAVVLARSGGSARRRRSRRHRRAAPRRSHRHRRRHPPDARRASPDGRGRDRGLALADSRRFAAVGWVAAALAPVEFGVLAYWIWTGFDGDTVARLGLSTLLVVVGHLAVVSQLLILSGSRSIPLVAVTGALVTCAIGGTVAAIWTEPDDTAYTKVLGATWILAALCWFLLSVLQRFTAASRPAEDRVLGARRGVELVATREPVPDAIDVRLAHGERLLLRDRG